jgi:hypothetical protein
MYDQALECLFCTPWEGKMEKAMTSIERARLLSVDADSSQKGHLRKQAWSTSQIRMTVLSTILVSTKIPSNEFKGTTKI